MENIELGKQMTVVLTLSVGENQLIKKKSGLYFLQFIKLKAVMELMLHNVT